MNHQQRPRRRFFRFSLRTLLLLMLVFGVWLGFYVRSVKRQQASVAAVERLGGKAYYDYQANVADGYDPNGESDVPQWLLDRLGRDAFHDVTMVTMLGSDPAMDDDGGSPGGLFQHLSGFPELKVLVHLNTNATGEELQPLENFDELRKFELWDAPRFTDAGAEQLTRLEHLHIRNSEVSDDSLPLIARLPHLKSLCLVDNRITNEGLKHLRHAKRLESLWIDLGDNGVTTEALASLSELTQLKLLSMSNTTVTDTGIDHLKRLPKLEKLYVYRHDGDFGKTFRPPRWNKLPNCQVLVVY